MPPTPPPPPQPQHGPVNRPSNTAPAATSRPVSGDAGTAPMATVVNLAHFVLNQMGPTPPGYNDCFEYLFHIRLEKQGVSALVTLVHHQQFSTEKLEQMLREAIDVNMNSRMIPRRKALNIKAGTDITKMNEEFFEQDVAFVRATLCDKYDFRYVPPKSVVGEIQRTARN